MSAHAILSPSSAKRWLNCTPAPRLEATFPDSASEYAAEGTLAHKVCELVARKRYTVMKRSTYNSKMKKLKADPLWQDEMLTTADTYMKHLMDNYMRFGAALHTALEVKVDISDYVPGSFGTCDCVMIGDNELIITDYKHGKGVPVSAKENPQLMLYALGALKLYRPIYGDTIKVVSICIDQPRIKIYDRYSLRVEDLLAWGENVVKPKAAAAFAGDGEFTPGQWCRFCRATAVCRARAGAHTALEDFIDVAFEANTVNTEPILTLTEIADLLTRGKTLVEWYEDLKSYALKASLHGEILPGWKLVEGRSMRVWMDQDSALEKIIQAGYERATVFDTVPKTLAGLEKLIGPDIFKGLVGDLIHKPPGKPALAPEGDKRPAYSRAAADFGGVSGE